jgi:hypothetical protein
MSIPCTPRPRAHRRAVRLLAVHLVVVAAGAAADGLWVPALLLLTAADFGLLLWSVGAHTAGRGDRDAGDGA